LRTGPRDPNVGNQYRRIVEYDTAHKENPTMLKKNLFPAIALMALAPVAFAIPDAGGGPPRAGGPAQAAPPPPPDAAKAKKAFTIGYEEYQMASGLENAGATMSGEAAMRNKEAVAAAFTRSRDRFRVAAQAGPDMKEAWNMLGYTNRKLGEYDESLFAYEKALALAPDYPEAIEYRAELYLLTGKLAQVKEAHAYLLKANASYADVLKTSINDWLKANKTAPGVAAADRAEFAAWAAKL
jgi:tetratricopeptide (TPR) repeat protein